MLEITARSSVDYSELARRPTRNRSRFTNDPSRLPNIDRRSAEGKRYRDIFNALLVEYGPQDAVRIRELAGLKVALELAQGGVVNGTVCSLDDLVRLANVVERREKSLRATKRQQRKPTPLRAFEKVTP